MTSLIEKIEHLLGTNTVKAIETFAENELDKAVAAAKTTPIGVAVAAAIKAAEDPALTSIQKIEQAVAAVAPVVISVAAGSGVTALLADAEVFARQVIESTLADAKTTGAAAIGKAVLAVADAAPNAPLH